MNANYSMDVAIQVAQGILASLTWEEKFNLLDGPANMDFGEAFNLDQQLELLKIVTRKVLVTRGELGDWWDEVRGINSL